MIPFGSFAVLFCIRYLDSSARITPEMLGITFVASALICLFFSISEDARPSPTLIEKQKAMRPPVNKALLLDKPTGIVFGRYKGKYVCRDLGKDGHVFLIGGSGSGKSSCLVIPTLLANPGTRVFAIDIKGELSLKAVRYSDDSVLIFNPSDRNCWGYDPLFLLNNKSSSQDILETMQGISFSLIAMPAGLQDPFWKLSARNLLTGLLVYYFKKGNHNFISIIDSILERPVKDSIEEVMKTAKSSSAEYRYIVQFSNMPDETLSGIFAELANHIVLFANDQDIRFSFKENVNKINPHMLEEGKSIFLSIREEKLSAYYDVLQLLINQTLGELEKRPENAESVIFVIDELPRILSAGKLDRLLDGARTLRSRKVILFLITQSTEALMSAFSENEVMDLISNCPYVVVLSASSYKTQQSVIAWCGKYYEKKRSWDGGGSKRKVSISFEEKDIVAASELMTLSDTGEAILISPYGYNRIKKVPWFKDPFFKPLADSNIAYNQDIMNKNGT